MILRSYSNGVVLAFCCQLFAPPFRKRIASNSGIVGMMEMKICGALRGKGGDVLVGACERKNIPWAGKRCLCKNVTCSISDSVQPAMKSK